MLSRWDITKAFRAALAAGCDAPSDSLLVTECGMLPG